MIKAIVAVDTNLGIGKSNDLLFHIKEDLKRFSEITKNSVVVCGRHTLESLPGGKPLKNRSTICLCNKSYNRDDCYCIHDFSECVSLIKELAKVQDIFIIGGSTLYAAMLEYCDELEITHIDADGKADTFFPNFFDSFTPVSGSPWKSENGIRYRFVTYHKNN